jgi:hypothetical protein
MTYELIRDAAGDAIRCLVCGMVSHNPNDISNRYCGNCRAFHSDLEARTKTSRGYDPARDYPD